jgi:hypothetical protein
MSLFAFIWFISQLQQQPLFESEDAAAARWLRAFFELNSPGKSCNQTAAPVSLSTMWKRSGADHAR